MNHGRNENIRITARSASLEIYSVYSPMISPNIDLTPSCQPSPSPSPAPCPSASQPISTS